MVAMVVIGWRNRWTGALSPAMSMQTSDPAKMKAVSA
jgi:hypothetical protein